jgi:hypothetical protein
MTKAIILKLQRPFETDEFSNKTTIGDIAIAQPNPFEVFNHWLSYGSAKEGLSSLKRPPST